MIILFISFPITKVNFLFCYEVETGHYFLFDNEYKVHAYLPGDDARIFRNQMEHIDTPKTKKAY